MSSETMQALAIKWGVPFYETSAKNGWHGTEVFHYLLEQMRRKYPSGEPKREKRWKGKCVIM